MLPLQLCIEISWISHSALVEIVRWLCDPCVFLIISVPNAYNYSFLAHLSRRLIGEHIGYSWSVCHRHSQCSKIFSETALPIKAKFYVELPWVGGMIFCSRHQGHMTKMAAMPIYGKNPSKIFYSRTGWPIFKKISM